jgi:dihydroorotate dehydrogenase
VVEKMRAGASVVQLYSAFSYEGPCLVTRVKEEVLARMKRDGVQKVTDYVGLDAMAEIERLRASDRESQSQASSARTHR